MIWSVSGTRAVDGVQATTLAVHTGASGHPRWLRVRTFAVRRTAGERGFAKLDRYTGACTCSVSGQGRIVHKA